MDYRQSVIECDQMEYTNIRLSLIDMRNNFTILHDLIEKNAEKIEKPRGSEGNMSSMY